MKWIIAIALLLSFSAANFGCEAKAKVDDDGAGAKVKVDHD